MSYEIQSRATPPPQLPRSPFCLNCGGTFAREWQVDGSSDLLCIQCGRAPFTGGSPMIGAPLDGTDAIPDPAGCDWDHANNQIDAFPRQGSTRRTLLSRPYFATGGCVVTNGPEVRVDRAAIDWDLKLPRGTPADKAKLPPPDPPKAATRANAKEPSVRSVRIPKDAPVVRPTPVPPRPAAVAEESYYRPPETVYRCDFCGKLSLTLGASEVHMGRDHAAYLLERIATWDAELTEITGRAASSITDEDMARLDKLCRHCDRAHKLLALGRMT